METINTATAFGSFAVKKLSEFKGFEGESGQYLVRKIEKGTGKESMGVVIPAATGEEAIAALDNDTITQGYIAWYQEQIAEVCKAKIATGATVLVPSDFSLAEVVTYLQKQEAESGRISKARIETWFEAQVQSKLLAALVAKFGDALDNDARLANIKNYKSAFATLAKAEVTLAPQVRQNLEKALALVEDSYMVQYCKRKIEASQDLSAQLAAL